MSEGTRLNSATLSVVFEGECLFVATWIKNLNSSKEARALLQRGLSLSSDGSGIFLCSGAVVSRRLCELEGDEFGRWPAGADRQSEEQHRSARIHLAEFLSYLPRDRSLQLAWWGITKYEYNRHGKLTSISKPAMENTDTLVPCETQSYSNQRRATM